MENNYTEIRRWNVIIKLHDEDHSKLYNIASRRKLILVQLITSHTLINISVNGLECEIKKWPRAYLFYLHLKPLILFGKLGYE